MCHPHCNEQPIRRQQPREARENHIPIEPVHTGPRRDKTIGRINSHRFNWPFNPAQPRVISTRQPSALPHSRPGEIHRIHPLYQPRQRTGHKSSAATRVQNRPRPAVRRQQINQQIERGRRILWPVPVRPHDALVLKDTGILVPKLARPPAHRRTSGSPHWRTRSPRRKLLINSACGCCTSHAFRSANPLSYSTARCSTRYPFPSASSTA